MIRVNGIVTKKNYNLKKLVDITKKKIYKNSFLFTKAFKFNLTYSKKLYLILLATNENEIAYQDSKNYFLCSNDLDFINQFNKSDKKVSFNKILKNTDYIHKNITLKINKKKNIFEIYKDIFGSKTIYYSNFKQNNLFSSEIKFIKYFSSKKITVNKNILINYISRNYRMVFGRKKTFYNEIKELQIGHKLTYYKKFTSRRYWTPFNIKILTNTKKQIQFYRSEIINNIKNCLRRSNKPVFLVSGGLDSPLVAGFAKKILNKKIDCMYASFPKFKDFDETKYIDELTKKIASNKIRIEINEKRFFKFFFKVSKFHDQPIISPVYVLTYYMYETAKKKGYTEIFGGGGGDVISHGCLEYQPYIFADYLKKSKLIFNFQIKKWEKILGPFLRYWPKNKYKMEKLINYICPNLNNMKHNKDWVNTNKNIFSKKFNSKHFYFKNHIKKYFNNFRNNRLFSEVIEQSDAVHFYEELNFSRVNIKSYDQLNKKSLFERAFTLPLSLITAEGFTKILYRKILKNVIPESLRNRPDKSGLAIPLSAWFKKNGLLIRYLKKEIDKKEYDFLNVEYIKKCIYEHQNNKNDFSWLIWNLISFIKWNEDNLSKKQDKKICKQYKLSRN